MLVISEYQPADKWSVSRAMTRNNTIIGLSDSMVVVEAGLTGGSMDAGLRTLEDSKPLFQEDKLLHQLCHKFYKQRMNHMKGLEAYSKISIFNTKNTDIVRMSVGQHYVQTLPTMNVMIGEDAFGLHIDKGFGESYYANKRKKMGENLSQTNINGGMGIEYLKREEDSIKEYREHQANSFNINQ